MYDFCYDYVNQNLVKNQNCVIWIQTVSLYIQKCDIYENIAEDVETRFDTSNYEFDRPLLKGKNKKLIGLIKDELGGKIMTRFVGLRRKTYSYLIDDSSEDKKAKRRKKCGNKKN